MGISKVVVDSETRSSGSPEDYVFNFARDVERVSGIAVTLLVVPKSVAQYGVVPYSDVGVYRDGLGTEHNVVFASQADAPQSFTTLSQLATALQADIRAATGTTDQTVTYDVTTGRLSIADTGGPGAIGFVSLAPVVQVLTGFDPGEFATNYVGNDVADLSWPRHLRLNLTLLGQGGSAQTTMAGEGDLQDATGFISLASGTAYSLVVHAPGIYGPIVAHGTAAARTVSGVRVQWSLPGGDTLPEGAFQGVSNQLYLTLEQEIVPFRGAGYGSKRRR